MANKKVVATITAVATSAALLMGGTMAWQSINQTALNEASAVVNPGGRLHDDFDGENKDVYVENFADEPIFARVRLDEHFEIQIDAGAVEIVTEHTYTDENGDVQTQETVRDDQQKYDIHIFGQPNATDPYWTWNTGGQTVYLPTFNMNKDSLTADINGTIQGTDGTYPWDDDNWTDVYDDYVEYTAGQEVVGDERHDNDSNDVEEMIEDPATGEKTPDDSTVKIIEDQTHTVTDTLYGSLISIEDWASLPDNMKVGPYWVYDNDGWVYWAQPIQPGTATGLLLDGIELRTVMDDGWYYAINAIAQFITADDLGRGTGTGFYDTENGTEPTAEALALLKAIGVDTSSVVSTVVDPDPEADPEEAKKEAAANLQRAFDEGGEISLDGTVTTDATAKPTETANYDAGFIWTEGGELKDGTIETTNPDAYAGIFINAETDWPVAGDSAVPATVTGTTISSEADFAVYIQAIDADVALNGVTVNGANGGVYAEHDSGTVTLTDVSVLARSGHSTDWVNSAVSAANDASVVINSGSYTGKYALYVFSSGGTITVNDGYFNGDIRLDGDNNTAGGHAEIYINGGYFNLENFVIGGDPSHFTITGGTFTADPSAYVTGAYEVVDNGDGTWTVQATA